MSGCRAAYGSLRENAPREGTATHRQASVTLPVSAAQKIHAALLAEEMILHAHKGAIDVGELSDFEMMLIDWGTVYGLAFGLARAEDPYESHNDAAGRAFLTACIEFQRWAGDMPEDRYSGEDGRPTEGKPWRTFWWKVARAATMALEEFPKNHKRYGQALWATNAARSAAKLPNVEQ